MIDYTTFENKAAENPAFNIVECLPAPDADSLLLYIGVDYGYKIVFDPAETTLPTGATVTLCVLENLDYAATV
jgi:hypothetical protein